LFVRDVPVVEAGVPGGFLDVVVAVLVVDAILNKTMTIFPCYGSQTSGVQYGCGCLSRGSLLGAGGIHGSSS
jgi:hypothetical protein